MPDHASTVVMPDSPKSSLRLVVWRLLETARDGDRASKIVDIFLVTLITVSLVAVVLESIPSLEMRYEAVFYWVEFVTVSVFTVEYLLRVWSAVEDPNLHARGLGINARLRFMVTPAAIIDLIAILPFYFMIFGLFGNIDMRFLRAVRLLRILKLTRYSSAFEMLATCCRENIRSLGAAFFVLLTVMLLAASGMYFFERHSQPIAFGSIPSAMWWAFSTLTTVGYGDVTPITVGGKVFGAMITVIGVGMVALPTGILASGYTEQIRIRSERYEVRAEEALDDGILTETEINDLESLRLNLGIGKHTASQILDSRMVRRALRPIVNEHQCPHCGGAIDRRDL